MRSPADMQTIQIEITNACNKRCSNCTRFCGNHKQNFFMDYDTFCRALDSLDGFDGVIGIMGGEPTLHPEFERFVLHIQDKFGKRQARNRLIYPQRAFIKEVRRREFESHVLRQNGENRQNFKMCGPGLWSNMGTTYLQHYEIIQDTFPVQFLNDHLNPSYHQPGLFSRHDQNIPDHEWIKLRDKCWIQNEWSASITPKGAFFCEIAAALDMLFDGPGGWPIESDWWRRKPADFADQLHWCELCGFALDTFMRDAKDEQDDVSPTLYEMLKKVESPRMAAGRTNLVKINDGVIAEESKADGKHFSAAQPYIEHYEDRFNEKNSVLFVHDYEKIVLVDGEGYGIKLNRALRDAKCDWILLSSQKINSDEEEKIHAFCRKYILNPGTLHLGDGFALFSQKAHSLKVFGYDRLAHIMKFAEIVAMWQPEKVVQMTEVDELAKWKHDSIIAGKRYALWGAGLSGGFIADEVQESGGKLVLVVDIDANKQGNEFYGATVYAPEYLRELGNDFDYLLIGHYTRFQDIKRDALAMGIPQEKIIMPYEV